MIIIDLLVHSARRQASNYQRDEQPLVLIVTHVVDPTEVASAKISMAMVQVMMKC